MLEKDLLLKAVSGLQEIEYLVQRNEGAFVDGQVNKFGRREVV